MPLDAASKKQGQKIGFGRPKKIRSAGAGAPPRETREKEPFDSLFENPLP
jgi:hypothetical protein